MRTLAPGVKVTDGALTQIVVRAAESVAGARVRRPRRRLTIDLDDRIGRVELELAVAYGLVLPDVAHEVQARVADALRRMCEVESVVVDVSVEELER
jgi:uncharacterized alkaline shock family protein YloU